MLLISKINILWNTFTIIRKEDTMKKFILITLALLLSSGISVLSKETEISALGFNFGMDDNDAIDYIESQGNEIIRNTEDSKELRIVVAKGVFTELPQIEEYSDLKTKLEFFKDKLFSTTLIIQSRDQQENNKVEKNLREYLDKQYGEPTEEDKMLYLSSCMWYSSDLKIMLSSNNERNLVMLDYTYEPIFQHRMVKEMEDKLETKFKDPARQMFIDGDYSKPGSHKEEKVIDY